MPGVTSWTDQQRAAIRHGGGGLLVSAAAGSGKTSVLAERCAFAVCDAAEPCDVDELLVVTFTESAATEMRDRIGRAIRGRADASDDPRLHRQAAMLDRASISTLHGFCARLLREQFHLLGLDPAFAILDADEADLLKREVARDLFADRYGSDDAAGAAFRSLVDAYADGDDERLVDRVVAAHESLCSVVDPARWTADADRRLAEAAALPLDRSELGQAYRDGLRRDLDGLLRECAAAGRFVADLGGFDGYVRHLREAYQTVKHLLSVLASHGLDALAGEAAGFEPPRLSPVRATVPNKDAAKARVDKVNEAIKRGLWRRRLAFTEQQWRDGLARTRPQAAAFLAVAGDFRQRYDAAKGDARSLDFNDLERRTLDVLTDDAGRPSAVARAYHARYRHVMVDEFQDINEVQDAILTLLSRECLGRPGTSNLFCVGDVKQSIYRFRLADPAQFTGRRRHYAGHADHGTVIDLRENFRGRAPLLAAVNAVFERLMTDAAADLTYDASHALVAGATFPPGGTFTGSPVELHLLPRDTAAAASDSGDDDGVDGGDSDAVELDRAQREAALVGHLILDMRRSGQAVVGRDGTARPVRFGDCVVLLRSMRFKAEAFAGQLRSMGVPTHADSRTGYFEATEVNDVLSLLRVLDNGRQDVPLAAVLRSPLVDLPDAAAAMARVRLAYPPGDDGTVVPFHEAVPRYADEHANDVAVALRHILGQLKAWRDDARDRPVADLLWSVFDRTGYLAYCGGLPRGEQRQANLTELHDKARQFGTFRRQGLGRFLVFLDRLRRESDLGQAAVASDADDVVQVMSVHRSKGREFPVVFVPDLGKGINTTDLNDSILLDRQLGLGLRVVDEDRRVRYPSLAWAVVRQRMRQQTLAEELRVLYVAMTRAKEHLVLIGTADAADAPARWRQQWAGHAGPFPAEAVLAARTPLDWLGPVAAAVGEDHLRVVAHDGAELAAWSAEQATPPVATAEQFARAELQPLIPPPPMTPAAAAVIGRIDADYKWASTLDRRAASAVTTLAKGGVTATPASVELDPPKFLAATTMTAADRGSATHVVLERIDFAVASTPAGIRAEVGRLRASGCIKPEEADAVDLDAIGWLMSTDVGRQLTAAGTGVRREVPIYFAHGEGEGLDRTMARGRVDALVPDGSGGWRIVDYKTDRVSGDGVDARTSVYREQMWLYRSALDAITGGRITGATLVFLHAREVREV